MGEALLAVVLIGAVVALVVGLFVFGPRVAAAGPGPGTRSVPFRGKQRTMRQALLVAPLQGASFAGLLWLLGEVPAGRLPFAVVFCTIAWGLFGAADVAIRTWRLPAQEAGVDGDASPSDGAGSAARVSGAEGE